MDTQRVVLAVEKSAQGVGRGVAEGRKTFGHSTLSNGSYGRVYVELPTRAGIALYSAL